MGRKTEFPTKIKAPEPMLKLYAAIAEVLATPDLLESCHVYHGAHLKGIPVIKYKSRPVSMPRIFANMFALNAGYKTCSTPGCCNPMHYLGKRPSSIIEEAPTMSTLSDDVDTLDYYIETYSLTPDFSTLRSAIPDDDMSDTRIKEALNEYHSQRQNP